MTGFDVTAAKLSILSELATVYDTQETEFDVLQDTMRLVPRFGRQTCMQVLCAQVAAQVDDFLRSQANVFVEAAVVMCQHIGLAASEMAADSFSCFHGRLIAETLDLCVRDIRIAMALLDAPTDPGAALEGSPVSTFESRWVVFTQTLNRIFLDLDGVTTATLNNAWDATGVGIGSTTSEASPEVEYGAHLPTTHLAQAAPVIPGWVTLVATSAYTAGMSETVQAARHQDDMLTQSRDSASYNREQYTSHMESLHQHAAAIVTCTGLLLYCAYAAACCNYTPRLGQEPVACNEVDAYDDLAMLAALVTKRRAATREGTSEPEESESEAISGSMQSMCGELWLRVSDAVTGLGIELDNAYPDMRQIPVGIEARMRLRHSDTVFRVLQRERQARSHAAGQPVTAAIDLALYGRCARRADSASQDVQFHTTCATELMKEALKRVYSV